MTAVLSNEFLIVLVSNTGPIVDILHGTAFVAMRSLLSKLVSPNELGILS